MADFIPDENIDRWFSFDTVTLAWIALDDVYSPGHGHTFVSAIAGNELSGSGYARSDPSASATRTVNTSSHRIEYDCDPPDFGPVVAGETCGAMALADVTSGVDSTSRVLGIWDLPDTPTTGSNLTPTPLDAHIHVHDQT